MARPRQRLPHLWANGGLSIASFKGQIGASSPKTRDLSDFLLEFLVAHGRLSFLLYPFTSFHIPEGREERVRGKK